MSDEELRPGAQNSAETVAAETAGGVSAHRARPWVITVASVLLAVGFVTGAGWGWQAFATAEVAAAHRSVTSASQALSEVTDARGMALDKARSTSGSMTGFLKQARPAYLAAATVTGLSTAKASLDAASAHLTFTPFTAPSVSSTSPDLLPWTVLADVQAKNSLARQEDTLGRKRAAELEKLSAAQKKFDAGSVAVAAALAAHGEEVLTGDASATYESKVALRHAIDDAKSAATARQVDGGGLLTVVKAIGGVDTSNAAGEAAKLDPAYPIRAQIEAYARSIAHGVTLDFQWHAQVSGLGEGWYSGTTVYRETDGGWATIDLNFPIQDGWARGDIDAKALVTHEVGHSQVVRPECEPLFTGPTFNSDDEMWATAWAISMGFDVGGSGISAYGRPSDAQIAVAGQCR